LSNRNKPDLEALPAFVHGHRLAALPPVDPEEDYDGEHVFVEDLRAADVVTSWTGERDDVNVKPGQERPLEDLLRMPETYHRPVLDIDFDAALIPSTSADHHHLYLDKVLTWTQYVRLLEVLAEVGIIEPGYRDASIAREYTSVRLPWVTKALPADPAPEMAE